MLASASFLPDATIATSDVAGVRETALVDIDNDGDDDVLYNGRREFGWIEFDASKNEFSIPQSLYEVRFSVYWFVDNVTPIDLDADGDLDISFNLRSTGEIPDFGTLRDARSGVNWLENLNGNGTFGQPKPISPEPAVEWVDVDNDGDLDFLSAHPFTGVRWSENQGDQFADPQSIIEAALSPVFNLTTTDVDADGDQDMITADIDGIFLFENIGGTFSLAQPIDPRGFGPVIDFLPPPPPIELQLSDLDGDGDLDLLSNLRYGTLLSWYENQGNAFGEKQEFPSQPRTGDFQTGDIDGDGDTDIVLDGIRWIEQTANQTFSAPQLIKDDAYSPIAVGRIDDDSHADIVTSDFFSNRIYWLELADDQETFQQFSVNGRALSVAEMELADMDSDGDQDLVIASRSGSLLWYADSTGFGDFDTEHKIADLTEIGSIEIADFNGDGNSDVAAAVTLGLEDHSLIFFPGDGAGSFADPVTITFDLTGGLSTLESGDVDGDGDADLITAGITWFENTRGDGSRWESELISRRPFYGGDAKLADVDNDGDQDIVATFDNYITIVWYEQVEQGSFERRELDHTDNAKSLSIADVDNDGDIDVLAHTGNDVQWHVNRDGRGLFSGPLVLGSSIGGQRVVSSDVDNDGDLDVIADNYWFEHLDGAGNFSAKIPFEVAANAVPFDYNGDQYVDIIGNSSDRIVAYRNIAPAPDLFGQEQIIGTPDWASTAALGDLDGDGDADALIASATHRLMWREKLDQKATFATPRLIDVNNDFFFALVTDIDSDGKLDAVASSVEGGRIHWYRNEGSGQFSDSKTVTLSAGRRSSLFAGDVDLDGDVDLFSKSRSHLAWYPNLDGLGTFGEERVISENHQGVAGITVRDFDQDGDLDIAGRSGFQEGAFWFRNENAQFESIRIDARQIEITDAFDADNDGDQDLVGILDRSLMVFENLDVTFGAGQAVTTLPTGTWLTTSGDMDGDGDIDIIYSNANRNRFETNWIRNDGDLRFNIRTEISDTFTGISPIVADINGDAEPDLLFARGPLLWYEASSRGMSFTERADAFGTVGSGVQVADFNNDGFGDILYSSRAGIARFENDQSGFFPSPEIISDQYSRATSADLDSDGDVDIVSTGVDSGDIEWFSNGPDGFGEAQLLAVNTGLTRRPEVFDVDADGDQDIVYSAKFGAEYQWIENLGVNSFADAAELSNLTELYRNLTPFDFDEDGDLDILGSGSSRGLLLAENLGNGEGFAEPRMLDSGGVHLIKIADVDADGDLDIVTRQSAFVLWYENHDGDFSNKDLIATEEFTALEVVDLDQDGDAEVLGARDDELVIFVNNHSGFARQTHPLPSLVHRNATAIELSDLDNDGDLDPIIISRDSVVTWVANEMAVPGDINRDGKLSVFDVDQLCTSLHNDIVDYDLDRDRLTNLADVEFLLNELHGTRLGDVNEDGVFDSADLVRIFQAGEYEDTVFGNSLWSTGDFNCDGDFNSSDLVAAFQQADFVAAAVEAVHAWEGDDDRRKASGLD